MLQSVARPPAARRRAGPAITPTVQPRLLSTSDLLLGGAATALLSGLVLAWQGHARQGAGRGPWPGERIVHRPPLLSAPAALVGSACLALGLVFASRWRR